MKDCRRIFGKFAFRRMNLEKRRGPVNKALFEAWSFIVRELDEASVNTLAANQEMLFDDYARLCSDYGFQNAIRAADRNSIKTRISSIRNIVDGIRRRIG